MASMAKYVSLPDEEYKHCLVLNQDELDVVYWLVNRSHTFHTLNVAFEKAADNMHDAMRNNGAQSTSGHIIDTEATV